MKKTVSASRSTKPKQGSAGNPSEFASALIDQLIARLADWRGKTLAGIRKSILASDREIVEEWKWMGSPVWSRGGIIAVATVLKDKVKITFAKGAHLPDPEKLFNAGLGGNQWRAIDLFEGDKINMGALKNLVGDAVALNLKGKSRTKPEPKTPRTASSVRKAQGKS